tara:strand:- start:4964 stop:5803 length:840 start_codon:yes stop_codon:yes gene_type:complete
MDYYKTLGVNRNASQDEIKKAFKKQAMKHHPDKGGDANTFQQVNEAYETLGNSNKKQQYDMFGATGNQNPRTQTWEFGGDFPNDIGDIFNDFFGGNRSPFQRRQFRKNRDIIIQADIELEDVLKGKELIATYRLTNGKEQSVNLTLPKGVDNSTTIKFPSLGDDYHSNAPRGDLLVRVRVRQHPIWNRDGPNLHTVQKVNVLDLITGTKTNIQTLEKRKLAISIPKGTQPGTVLSITEQGLPTRGNVRGNLYITIQGDVPNINDPKILEQVQRMKNETN